MPLAFLLPRWIVAAQAKRLPDTPPRPLQFLLSRLERISADSVAAHRASGVRGAMLRVLDQLERGRPVPGQELKCLIESGYQLLQKAAEEKVR